MNVAILGASNKSDRYSFKALQSLRKHGHSIYPLHPLLEEIDGVKVYRDLDLLPVAIDTLTLYVGAEISGKLGEKIIKLKPRRVIFNPGAENPVLSGQLEASGILTQQACTLVLLSTNQF